MARGGTYPARIERRGCTGTGVYAVRREHEQSSGKEIGLLSEPPAEGIAASGDERESAARGISQPPEAYVGAVALPLA